MTSDTLIAPARGFDLSEFAQRTERMQHLMAERSIDAVFFTTEPEFRYFSGFRSQFWESPTRPWFLIVPASGRPIAVVPEIGLTGLEQTWVHDVRSWRSPRPEDDGVSLLADALSSVSGRHKRIGAMLGAETHLRMPVANFSALTQRLSKHEIVDSSIMMRALRVVKSPAEVAKIRFACEVTAAGFEHLRTRLCIGMSERQACKAMHLEMLRLGADACPYLVSASGPGGYDNIIMGPTDRRLENGDVLIIDTGANFDGYFSDFDRNYAFGEVDPQASRAYETVFESTEAALRIAAPERTTGDIWQAMWSVLEKAGALSNVCDPRTIPFQRGIDRQEFAFLNNLGGEDIGQCTAQRVTH